MTNQVNAVPVESTSSNRKAKLIMSIVFDAIGMLSYAVPLLAEVTDVVWAPISGMLLVAMYKGSTGKIAGMVGFLEEILPGVDFIPTFTLTWIYTYIIKKEQ
jgi:hypothetical protein